jgi:hypothetical protein
MNLKYLFVAVAAGLCILGNWTANAGQTVNELGAIACVQDKWDMTKLENGNKLYDYAGRCVHVPDDDAAQKSADDCVGKYEYMPNGSYKGSGTCTLNFKDKSSITGTWEEGSDLKEFTWTVTGGTGKYDGVSGGGTYTLDGLTDTLFGGKYKGQLILP